MQKKSQKDEPASYGTVGAHFGLGSMSRTGREGEHGSSFEATMRELEKEERTKGEGGGEGEGRAGARARAGPGEG